MSCVEHAFAIRPPSFYILDFDNANNFLLAPNTHGLVQFKNVLSFDHVMYVTIYLYICYIVFSNMTAYICQPVYVGIYLPLAPVYSNYQLETKKHNLKGFCNK